MERKLLWVVAAITLLDHFCKLHSAGFTLLYTIRWTLRVAQFSLLFWGFVAKSHIQKQANPTIQAR